MKVAVLACGPSLPRHYSRDHAFDERLNWQYNRDREQGLATAAIFHEHGPTKWERIQS